MTPEKNSEEILKFLKYEERSGEIVVTDLRMIGEFEDDDEYEDRENSENFENDDFDDDEEFPKEISLPRQMDGLPVTMLGVPDFKNESVPPIWGTDRDEFYGCPLTRLILPDTIRKIDGNLFNNCACLTAIDVSPENPFFKSEDGVLFSKDGRRLIVYPPGKGEEEGIYKIPEGVETIGERAFGDSVYLTSVIFPESLKSIELDAFSGCSSLTRLELPEGLELIGSRAFGHTQLTAVRLPSSLRQIGENPFLFAFCLTSIEVSPENPFFKSEDGVLFSKDGRRLIVYPMKKENNGEIYKIPAGVTMIEKNAINGSSLTSIELPDSLTSIDDWGLANNNDLTSIIFPDHLELIGDWSFCCSSLTTLDFPKSLKSIGGRAFGSNRFLTSVTLSDSLQTIGENAFKDCEKLTIYGQHGSLAEAYAKENGIKFIAKDE